MVYEYAIEPELFATWCDPLRAQIVDNSFGLGTPRVLSTDMKKSRWKSKVFTAFESWVDTIPLSDDAVKNEADKQSLRKNITELIQGITEYSVQRPNWKFHPDKTWLDNALEEHRKNNFHALICKQNVGHCDDMISQVDFERGSHSKWLLDMQKDIPSNAYEMAKVLEPLLKIAKKIIFVDPYFGGDKRRWRKTLQQFFQVVSTSHWKMSGVQLEIHASKDIEKAPSTEHFKEKCEHYMPRIIPLEFQVKFVRWSRFPDGKELHDRYVLTELGGVDVSPGLDDRIELTRGATTKFKLLSENLHKTLWDEYANGRAFKLAEEPFLITGIRS